MLRLCMFTLRRRMPTMAKVTDTRVKMASPCSQVNPCGWMKKLDTADDHCRNPGATEIAVRAVAAGAEDLNGAEGDRRESGDRVGGDERREMTHEDKIVSLS